MFIDFHGARDDNGTWNAIRRATLPPDIPPELLAYAQGMRFMSGMLEDDVRILKSIHNMNPTRFNAQVRGSNQSDRERESDWKLCMASWWDNDLNFGRWLDDYRYEGQIQHGAVVPRIVWDPHDNGDGTSGCPVRVDKTVLDGMYWQGDYRNPKAAWYRYSVGVIDCDLKNSKGERPYYKDGTEDLGWTSEDLPSLFSTTGSFYRWNQHKTVEVIVRDAEDYVAMCPVDGCTHRKRKIAVYICKADGKADDYEKVTEYDSPFERCSFMVVGGDIRHTERDPHRIFRPSAWVLFDLVLKYNILLTELFIMHRRELAQESKYVDASGTDPAVLQALHGKEDSGQSNLVDLPEAGSREMAVIAGPVKSYGIPSTELLKMMLAEIKQEYVLRRPNPAQTGQMALSEVTGTGTMQQVAGAGTLISPDLVNVDGNTVRIFEETRHAIRFTDYYATDPTRYVATVSGRENVMGSRSDHKPGDEVYIDPKKAEKGVHFSANTSKDTPAEQRERRLLALTGFKEKILTKDQLLEDWDIFDVELQQKLLFREEAVMLATPLVQRRMIMYLTAKSASKTGMDLGEEPLAQGLPDPQNPGAPSGGQQTINTQAANNERLHSPPVTMPATGSPAGGASGLAGP